MLINKGDILKMKKPHPCGGNQFLVLKPGMDFKLRCLNCGKDIIIPRLKAEKNIKQIIKEDK